MWQKVTETGVYSLNFFECITHTTNQGYYIYTFVYCKDDNFGYDFYYSQVYSWDEVTVGTILNTQSL